MINFSVIPRKSFLGRFLRLILWFIPGFTIVPVFQGVLKGCKWIKGSGVNGYWLGTYEKQEQEIFAKKVKEGDVVFDIGANVGFYSLIASKIVGDRGKVYAFEPAPKNTLLLKKHFELNNCINSIVVLAGVSDKNDLVYFNEGSHAATGYLSMEDGNILVPVLGLEELVDNGKILAPNLMKIDVEGSEFKVLTGAKKILEKYHPTIFLSTHNEIVHRECLELLLSLNYKLESIDNLGINVTSEMFQLLNSELLVFLYRKNE